MIEYQKLTEIYKNLYEWNFHFQQYERIEILFSNSGRKQNLRQSLNAKVLLGGWLLGKKDNNERKFMGGKANTKWWATGWALGLLETLLATQSCGMRGNTAPWTPGGREKGKALILSFSSSASCCPELSPWSLYSPMLPRGVTWTLQSAAGDFRCRMRHFM